MSRYDWKTLRGKLPAEYSQGALYVTDVFRTSFLFESRTGRVVSSGRQYERLTASLEKRLDGKIEAAARAERERQLKAEKAKEQERQTQRYKSLIQQRSFQVQAAAEAGDKIRFTDLTKDYPELIKSGFNGGWISLAFYSDELPKSVKVDFIRFLRSKGCDINRGGLLHRIISEACYQVYQVVTLRGEDKYLEQASVLLDAGADPNVRDARGLTPLDILLRSGSNAANGRLADLLRSRNGKSYQELDPAPKSNSDGGLLPLFGAREFKWADYRGKVLIIAFCSPSQLGFGHAIAKRLLGQHHAKGLRIIFVGRGDRVDVTEEAKRYPDLLIYLDRANTFASECGAESELSRGTGWAGLWVLVDRSGAIVDHFDAYNTPDKNLVEKLERAGLWRDKD